MKHFIIIVIACASVGRFYCANSQMSPIYGLRRAFGVVGIPGLRT